MKLAVLSDVHGNLVALDAALADLEAAGDVDKIWILGDLAVFGTRPVECIRRVRELQVRYDEGVVQVIGGNTDRYLVTGERPSFHRANDAGSLAKLVRFLSQRDAIVNWNRESLSWEDYEFLAKIIGREVDLKAGGYGHVIGYHGTPGDDEGMLAPDTPDEEARDSLLDREGRMGIGGHTHLQMDRDLGDWRAVNVGSVGMSFDMPGKAQWGLFTFEDGAAHVDLRAVPFDVDAYLADLDAVNYPAPEWVAGRFRAKA